MSSKPEPAPARVQIVTVAYNSSDVIGTMLASVPPQVSVLIVDNGSSDMEALQQVAARYGARLLHNVENLGFGSACNKGAAESSRPWLFFVNPDAALRPGCVERLCEAAAGAGPVGAFVPRVLDARGRHAFRWRSRLLTRRERWSGPPPEGDCDVPLLNGAGIFVELSVFKGVGGFDETIFLYHEDDDLSVRIKARYGPLRHVHDAVMDHSEGHSTARTPQVAAFKAYHMARSAVYTMRKHGRPWPVFQVLWSAFWGMLSPLNLLSARKRAKSIAFLKGAFAEPLGTERRMTK